MDVFQRYQTLANTPSDINEHLPTLMNLAQQCESVLELGVRGCVSSWAFLAGLLQNNQPKKNLIMNDLNECPVQEVVERGRSLGVNMEYKWCNDLDLDVDGIPIDMVFIDTWHVYGQLKRELAKFSKVARKYIALHDTTVDEEFGETIRMGWNAQRQSLETGIPVDEIRKGLWPAVEEFLNANPEWKLVHRYTNNNGLTILKRV